MKKVLLCIAAAAVFSGCVSSRTYKAAFDESEARRLQIERLSKELDAEKASGEKSGRDIAELAAAKDRETSALNSRLDELKKENERLAEAGAGDAAVAASLAKENAALKAEVERLRIKAGEINSEKERELANVRGTYEKLVKEMQKEIEKGDIKITQAVDRLSVNMVEKILFDSGNAEVKPEGLLVLKRVGDILKSVADKQIRVEGHTDNKQIGARIREKYPTNWELSTARATNVVRYLQDKVGIEKKLLSAAGLADNKPVATNDTLDGRAQNRRIEIVLLPLDVDRVLEELKK